MAVIDKIEKDLLMSEMWLTSVAVKLNRVKEGSDGRYEPRRLDECIHQVVEAANRVDEILDEAGRDPPG